MTHVKFIPETHKYFDKTGREYPSVSSILQHFGISQIDKMKAIHGEEHIKILADFGHEVHKLTAADDRGELDDWEYDHSVNPWLAGWAKYRMDSEVKFIAIEEPLISRVWGFAGTPDRIAEGGSNWLEIPDIKTGAKTVAEELQTAFYAILAEENYLSSFSEFLRLQ